MAPSPDLPLARRPGVPILGAIALAVLSGCASDTGLFGDAPVASGGMPAGGAGAGASAGASSGGQGGRAGASGSGGQSQSGSGGQSASGTGGMAGQSPVGNGGASGSAGAGKSGSGGAGGAGAGGKGGGAGASAGGGAGSGGGSAGQSAGSGGSASGAGGKASGGCAGRDLLICEDFEDVDVGEVPSGWTREGDVSVADDDARGGERSLKVEPRNNGERRIVHDAALLGSAHWGRIFYKVALPVPDAFVHSTMVSLIGEGPMNGRSDYRPIDTVKQAKNTPDVGSRHNWIYNVQIIGESEFGRETQYDYTFDGMWHCAEYHIQASNQSFTFYWDGEQRLTFENGAGNYNRSDIPNEFENLRVGWNNYQSASPGFTVWIDDIAFHDERIGCE